MPPTVFVAFASSYILHFPSLLVSQRSFVGKHKHTHAHVPRILPETKVSMFLVELCMYYNYYVV